MSRRLIESPHLAAKMTNVAIHSINKNGFSVGSVHVRWSAVRKITTYKYDNLIYDDICLTFEIENDDSIEVTENDPGFKELINEMERQYPSIPKDWFSTVMHPAFAPNQRELWPSLDNPPAPLHNGRFSMADSSNHSIHIQPEYEPLLRAMGLTGPDVFTSHLIKPWRTLPDRENCTLDFVFHGQSTRLHVKRYPAVGGSKTPAEIEYGGLSALIAAKIPTSPLVAWGVLPDSRSFLITADLAGYVPGDKLVEQGTPFDPLLVPTADLAAKLHLAGLHHRDLYLCHFLTKFDGDQPDLRLIDTARVAPLRNVFTRSRWIVKDLAQFWYSTTKLPVTDEQRDAWIKRYAEQRGLPGCVGLKKAVLRKVAWIAKHDRSLNAKQPGRNVSIPT